MTVFLLHLLCFITDPTPGPNEHAVPIPLTLYGNDAGIDQLAFYNIRRDAAGFLWFGTQDGLVRFDGYTFTVFRHDPGDPHSLSGNFLTWYAPAEDGRLWVVSPLGGLDLYDPVLERFRRLTLPGIKVLRAYHVKTDTVLIRAETGLYLYELDGTPRPVADPAVTGDVYRLGRDTDGRFLFTAASGLYRLDLSDESLQKLPLPDGFDPKELLQTTTAGDGRIWVSAAYSRLLIFDPTHGTLTPPPGFEGEREGLVRSILRGRDGGMWVSTSKGLYYFDLAGGPPRSFERDGYNEALAAVQSIYQDDDGTVWLGAYGHGLLRFHPDVRLMGHYLRTSSNSDAFKGNLIRGFAEAPDGTLWIAGDSCMFQMKDGRFQSPKPPVFPDKALSIATGLNFDRDGNLWAASFSFGLVRHQPDTGRTDYFRLPEDSPLESLTITRDGTLWVGSLDQSVWRFDPKTETLEPFYHDGRPGRRHSMVLGLYEDRAQRLWACAFADGLFVMEPGSGVFTRYAGNDHPSPLRDAVCMIEDHRGRLWVGTAGGLVLLQPGDTYRRWTALDGLPNNNIYSLLVDRAGYLWLSTNKGLARFDPDAHHVEVFGVEDGVQGNEFNSNAGLMLQDGRLAFGGVNGFNLFDPAAVFVAHPPPTALIADFLLDNVSVPITDDGILPTAAWRVGEIHLPHDRRVFGFEFAAPDARSPGHARFAYLLEGFDTRWQETPASRRYAAYTNLPAGSYRMRVKCAGVRGPFGPEASVVVTVAPSPLRSPLAYFLYVCTASLLVAGYLWRQRRLRRMLRRMVHEATAQLEARNNELRALDKVVAGINEVMKPEEVLEGLTYELHRRFPGADRVAYVLADPVTGMFQITAVRGLEDDAPPLPRVPIKDVQRRFNHLLDQVARGVYLAHDCADMFKQPHLGHTPPAALIVLEIRFEGREDGYLTIANLSNPNAFRDTDVETLSRVRRHAVIALSKARNIADLVEAQQALIDNAHAGGMAELAMEVMHNIGSLANNAKTSAQLMREALDRLEIEEPLRRLAQVLQEKDPEQAVQAGLWLSRFADRGRNHLIRLKGEAERLDYHLQEITRDLFAQQVHTGAGAATLEAVNLNSLVEDLLRAERYLLHQARIEVVRQYAPTVVVTADNCRLRRVVTYLLGNAREALRVDRPVLTVLTGVDGGMGFLDIADNGQGIAAEHLAQVFRPGFTTHPDRRGFGLHYCANAVKEMAGTITLHSDGPGCGCRVRICLPSAPASGTVAESPSSGT